MNYHYENIERYVKGKLSPEEKLAFEQEMAKDSDLKSAVENHDIARLIFDGLEEEDIRNQVEKVKHKTTANHARMWWRGVAAGAVLLLGLVWWMSRSSIINYDVLYAQVFDKQPAILAGNRSGDLDTISRAFDLFEKGEGDQGLALLNSFQGRNKAFVIGIFHMNLENFETAIGHLTDEIDQGLLDAYFYRGLCYLKTKDIEAARLDFETALNNGDNRVKAHNILKKLK